MAVDTTSAGLVRLVQDTRVPVSDVDIADSVKRILDNYPSNADPYGVPEGVLIHGVPYASLALDALSRAGVLVVDDSFDPSTGAELHYRFVADALSKYSS